MRQQHMLWILSILVTRFHAFKSPPPSQHQEGKIAQTNLLFIIFDDLRPELPVYGKSHIIAPNFDRLAARSIVFDSVYSQVAVCNPSRDSLLTGLRPDTLGNYAFQASFKPHLTFPTQLARSGYRTSGYGKIMHWDGNDREVWNGEQYWGDWYENQNREWDHMKSTVWPDHSKNVSAFYDFDFATRAIINLRKQAAIQSEYFMTAIGFKLPHTLLHFPRSYFDLYRARFSGPEFVNITAAVANRSMFPASISTIAYRCCAGDQFRYMNSEGAKKSSATKDLKHGADLDRPLPEQMVRELQWGYSSAISFVDSQLGRVLDVLDELNLWSNLTIVLTADHGMHNGEKGIWEKWTLFDEATRVPLMIHHPLSPFQGQHYTEPVELIDIFPTVIDLLNAPYDKEKIYNAKRARHPRRYLPLGGKSLAPMVLGMSMAPQMWSFRQGQSVVEDYYLPTADVGHRRASASTLTRPLRQAKRQAAVAATAQTTTRATHTAALPAQTMPRHKLQMAISQIWRCSPKVLTALEPRNASHQGRVKGWYKLNRREDRLLQWLDCDMKNSSQAIIQEEDSFMGYSMRTLDFRYTVWVPFDREKMMPRWDLGSGDGGGGGSGSSAISPSIRYFQEELYDHRDDGFAATLLGQRELVNLAPQQAFSRVLLLQRQRLLHHLYYNVLYKSAVPTAEKGSKKKTSSWANTKWEAFFSKHA